MTASKDFSLFDLGGGKTLLRLISVGSYRKPDFQGTAAQSGAFGSIPILHNSISLIASILDRWSLGANPSEVGL
jgi:hypothetical protein